MDHSIPRHCHRAHRSGAAGPPPSSAGMTPPSQEAGRQQLLQRLSGDHFRHGDDEDGERQDEAYPEPAGHVSEFRIGLFLAGYGTGLQPCRIWGTRRAHC